MRYFSRALDLSKDAQLTALIAYELGTSAFLAEQYPLASTSFGRVLGNAPTSTLAGPSLFWRAQALEKQGEKQATGGARRLCGICEKISARRFLRRCRCRHGTRGVVSQTIRGGAHGP